jgi:hypothetical protein
MPALAEPAMGVAWVGSRSGNLDACYQERYTGQTKEALMNRKTFLILGRYGGVGRPLARLLLQETDVRLVLAGRTVEKAQAAAASGMGLLQYLASLVVSTALFQRIKGHEGAISVVLLAVSLACIATLRGSARMPATPGVASPDLPSWTGPSAIFEPVPLATQHRTQHPSPFIPPRRQRSLPQ